MPLNFRYGGMPRFGHKCDRFIVFFIIFIFPGSITTLLTLFYTAQDLFIIGSGSLLLQKS